MTHLVILAGDEIVGLAHISKKVEGAASEAGHDGIRLAATASVTALRTKAKSSA